MSTTPDGDVRQANDLWSLGYYENLRRTAPQVTRQEGSNVDVVTIDGDGTDPQVVPICHMDMMVGFAPDSFSSHAVIAMAVHHLNVGDGRFVPDLEGLPERCPVRFTIEGTQAGISADTALRAMKANIRGRTDIDYATSKPAPCAILGQSFSRDTSLTAAVSGVFDIPQASGSAQSAALDDKGIYPTFGRVIPSVNGISITILQFLYDVLGVRHFSIVHENDAFQNSFAESLKKDIAEYAPGMVLNDIVYDASSPTGASEAVQRLKDTRHRFILCTVYVTGSTPLFEEALAQGVAGDGLHQWFLHQDSFSQEWLQPVETNSKWNKFFQGVGVIQLMSGDPNSPVHDLLSAELASLPTAPANKDYFASMLETVYPPDHLYEVVLGPDSHYGQGRQTIDSYGKFWYDSVIALGLAACGAWNAETKTLHGLDHFDSMRGLSFNGTTGNAVLNNVTGSREPTSAFYRLLNFRRAPFNETFSIFPPITSYNYVDGAWVLQDAYVFNDGTTDIPIDIGPLPVVEETFLDNTYAVVGVAVAFVAVLIVAYAIVREMRRKANDMLWRIKKEDVVFSDPRQVLGRGTFGEVLLAEYRGTKVAVKQILAAKMNQKLGTATMHKSGIPTHRYKMSGPVSSNSGSGNVSDEETGLRSGSFGKSMKGSTAMQRRAHNLQKQLRDDLLEEMRQLSRLRHPNVATIMGAVVDKETPMLVMEYMPLGSLYDVIHNPIIHLDGGMVVNILSDITQGLRFLHKSEPPVIHGDLKAQNVLVDSYFRAKVADFGLTQKKDAGTGTPFWMAPELLRQESTNTSASDVFSFGVLMFEVCARQEPYEGEDGHKVIAAIQDKRIQKRVFIPSYLPDKVKSVMMDCMEENPTARATFDEIDTRLRRLDAKMFEGGSTPKPEQSAMHALPSHIAKTLEQGGRVENEVRNNVSIFACSIAGWEDICDSLRPVEISRLLGRVETVLRTLATKHGVLLLETSDSVFMAASNVVGEPVADHATRLAAFALEVCSNNEIELNKSNHCTDACVSLQAGLHTGTVTTGVVGTRHPRFSLFGEDVLIATQLAKSSKLGRVNASRTTAKILETAGTNWVVRLRDDACVTLRCGEGIDSFWISRKTAGNFNVLERVRAAQNLRILKHTLNQSNDKLVSLQEDIAETEDSQSDMEGLKDTLATRLSRNCNL